MVQHLQVLRVGTNKTPGYMVAVNLLNN